MTVSPDWSIYSMPTKANPQQFPVSVCLVGIDKLILKRRWKGKVLGVAKTISKDNRAVGRTVSGAQIYDNALFLEYGIVFVF